MIFDIWGDYGHFKKIYATTSAVSYSVPPKTSLYGYMGAILGLSKTENAYLTAFSNKQCLVGISVVNPVVMKRLGTNLRPNLNRTSDNPKPTMVEYVHQPKYRLYVSHSDSAFYSELRAALQEHRSVYTPSLGLASLVSNFGWISEANAELMTSTTHVPIHSVIPKSRLIELNFQQLTQSKERSELVEQTMYAVEMNTNREVTERDDILFDRQGWVRDLANPEQPSTPRPIHAKVTQYDVIGDTNIICF